MARHEITAADIMPAEDYARVRMQKRREMGARKRLRRVAVGPHVMFYFESYETMLLQVQEMLHIERGGDAQLADELAAYNPLVPNGHELVATFMIEIDDPDRRKAVLAGLGGVEEAAFLRVGDATIRGVPEQDQDRTTAEGKASSVQFVHFPFDAAELTAFVRPGAAVVLGLDHPAYGHMAVVPEQVRAELAGDLTQR